MIVPWRHLVNDEWYRLVTQPEIAKKSIKPPILAFKVIQGHWIRRQSRTSVWLPIIPIHRPYLAPLRRYGNLLAKNRKFCPPPSHLAPSFRVTPFEFMEKLYDETRVFQAANGEDSVILACTAFDWSNRVTERWTEEQTDRQTDGQNCDG